MYEEEKRKKLNEEIIDQKRQEETCHRGFFDNVRSKQENVKIPIESLKDRNGTLKTDQSDLNKICDDFYCGEGGLLNLGTQGDEDTQHLLLRALEEDRRAIPDHLREKLEFNSWMTDTNVMKACKKLNAHTSPGMYGLTGEFFILFGGYPEKKGEDEGGDGEEDEQPPHLASIIAMGCRAMLNLRKTNKQMKEAYLIPIPKDIDNTTDLNFYRPITVLNTLYKTIV